MRFRVVVVIEMECFFCIFMVDWVRNKNLKFWRERECVNWFFFFEEYDLLFFLCYLFICYLSSLYVFIYFFFISGRYVGWVEGLFFVVEGGIWREFIKFGEYFSFC